MRDRTLDSLLIILLAVMAAHDLDHYFRGDFVSLPLATALLATVPRYGTLGARFWAVVALFGGGVLWFAHLSPFTPQTPQYIYAAYASPLAGAAAVTLLAVFALLLIALAAYAEYVWARGPDGRFR